MTKRTETPDDQPTPAQPQPSTVVAEPATVEACAADYQQREGRNPGGQCTATPHTHHRR